MTPHQDAWFAVLAAAAGRLQRIDPGPAALGHVATALRLAWATEGAVEPAEAAGEQWWLRLAELVADAADQLDLVPGAAPVLLGTGPAPHAALADTLTLRRAVRVLLAAADRALRAHAQAADGAAGGAAELATALAAWSTARAVQETGP